MNFHCESNMQSAMRFIFIGTIFMHSVSSFKIPDLASLLYKSQSNETKADESNSTAAAVPSVIDNLNLTTTVKPEDATFNPDDVLYQPKSVNGTATNVKVETRKTISYEQAQKIAEAKNPPVIGLKSNVTELPPPAETPKHIPHDLTKEPESIDLATRKLFEREDYGPDTKDKKTTIKTIE